MMKILLQSPIHSSRWFLAAIALFITQSATAQAKKIVWVDAYHPELEWSQEILKGIQSVFAQRIQSGDIELKVIYLDTKNHPGDAFARQAASKANHSIHDYDPDLIIAGDDASAKYLIQPYYVAKPIPVVFCGINFNADQYEFGKTQKAPNVTGIIEVPPVDIAIKAARQYKKGNRYGYITFDDLSERGNFEGIVNQFNIHIPKANVAYVSSMKEWKSAYLKLRSQVDILIMGSSNFMQGWNWKEADQFILENTTSSQAIPITYNHWTIDIALLSYSKRGTEQGEWAAKAAIEILFEGKQPAEIPFGRNYQGDLLLNKRLADRLGIQFTASDLEHGQLIESPINESAQ